MGELPGKTEQQMLAGQFLDMVGPEFHQPALGLSLREAGEGGFQAGESLVGGERVDAHGDGGWHALSAPPVPSLIRQERCALTMLNYCQVHARRGRHNAEPAPSPVLSRKGPASSRVLPAGPGRSSVCPAIPAR